MNSDEKNISISRTFGTAIDFLVIGVPIALTVVVVGVFMVVLLPEFCMAVFGSVAILGMARWLNRRDDEYRAKRYVQVPDFDGGSQNAIASGGDERPHCLSGKFRDGR